jgi:integrase
MSKKRELPEYVYEIPKHSGRYYFQRFEGSQRHRMKVKLYSPQFWEIYAGWIKAYADAKPGQMVVLETGLQPKATAFTKPVSQVITAPHSWRWLCQQYFTSTTYADLEVSSRRVRKRVLEATWDEPIHPDTPNLRYGDMPVTKFRAKAIKVLRDRKTWKEEVENEEGDIIEVRRNTEAANSRVKYIRAVLNWAKEEPEIADLVEHRNWAEDVAYFPPKSDAGIPTWSLADIEQFRTEFPIGSKARLAMELLLFTLQRRSDVVKLGWQVLKSDSEGRPMFIFTQTKNRKRKRVTAYVPLFPELQAIIDATPDRGDMIYLVSERGTPWASGESFGNWFHDRCSEAKLKDRSAHGLRKAGVVELIRRKYTPQQIMALSGHKTMKEIDRYAREYLRQQAAEQVLDEWLKMYENAA